MHTYQTQTKITPIIPFTWIPIKIAARVANGFSPTFTDTSLGSSISLIKDKTKISQSYL